MSAGLVRVAPSRKTKRGRYPLSPLFARINHWVIGVGKKDKWVYVTYETLGWLKQRWLGWV